MFAEVDSFTNLKIDIKRSIANSDRSPGSYLLLYTLDCLNFKIHEISVYPLKYIMMYNIKFSA